MLFPTHQVDDKDKTPCAIIVIQHVVTLEEIAVIMSQLEMADEPINPESVERELKLTFEGKGSLHVDYYWVDTYNSESYEANQQEYRKKAAEMFPKFVKS